MKKADHPERLTSHLGPVLHFDLVRQTRRVLPGILRLVCLVRLFALPIWADLMRGPAYRGDALPPTSFSSRQIGLPHQEAIALSRRPASLVDRPDDQALSPPHVACGKHARDAGDELPMLRLRVTTRVLRHAELIDQVLLRP